MKHILTAILGVLLFSFPCQAQQGAQTELIFPFFVLGTARPDPINPSHWRVEFDATNPTSQQVKVQFEFFGGSGQLLSVGDDVILPLGSRKLLQLGLGGDALQTGWIKVTASQPIFVHGSNSLISALRFSAPVFGDFIEASTTLQPGVGFTESRIFVEKRTGQAGSTGSSKTTGIALTFPQQGLNQQAASGEIRLLDDKGNEVGRQAVNIPVNSQKVCLVEELFPELREKIPPGIERDFFGVLEVRFPNLASPIFAKAVLIQTSGLVLFRDAGIVRIR